MLRVMGSGDRGDPSDDIALAQTESPPVGHTVPSDSAAEGIGERPDSDQIARAVAKARIANQLFSKQQSVKLGRYHLLEKVGSGGMGVVWGAWDPELDRRVAIKLVKATMQAARDRILLEGQALAKLSHPNVVPVYDVGVVDEQVYLVMEWVRGKNLRAYCKEPRTVRELLAVYRAAGEGLSAAHRVGLIHRDFKPDNAMFGDDGRVRVLDFGLARGEAKAPDPDSDEKYSSDLTRGAGTPRYMPAEQAEGRELTPAVDQYSFCVSLREALVGRNADGNNDAVMPRWLDEILTEGTSREPANRYGSMDELLRALARDPATVWRRRALVAGALGFAGITFAVGTTRSEELEVCGGSDEQIARTWNPATRDKMIEHIRALGPYADAEATRLANVFDDYRDKWAVAHRDACIAQERKELTPQLYETTLGCLARTRIEFETAIDLASRARADRLPNVAEAASALPSSALCLIATQASTVKPAPSAIATKVAVLGSMVARARMLAIAQTEDSLKETARVAEETRKLNYLPLFARAKLEQGIALKLQGDSKLAFEALDEATRAALASHEDVVAVEAFARALHLVATSEVKDLPANAKERVGAMDFVAAIADRLGPEGAFAKALLHNNIGVLHFTTGSGDKARASFELARIHAGNVVEKHAELNTVWRSVAMFSEDPHVREQLLKQVGLDLADELGPDHPNTLQAKIDHAMLVRHRDRALETLRAPCDRYQQVHPHLQEKIAECAFEVGWLSEERGDLVGARAAMAAIKFSTAYERVLASGYFLQLDENHAEVVRTMSAFVDERLREEHLYARFRAVDAIQLIATSLVQLGRRAEAVERLRGALEILDGLPFLKKLTFYQRRLARIQARLALLGYEPARYASLASAWYEEAGGYADVLRELRAIKDSR